MEAVMRENKPTAEKKPETSDNEYQAAELMSKAVKTVVVKC